MSECSLADLCTTFPTPSVDVIPAGSFLAGSSLVPSVTFPTDHFAYCCLYPGAGSTLSLQRKLQTSGQDFCGPAQDLKLEVEKWGICPRVELLLYRQELRYVDPRLLGLPFLV